MSFEIYDIELPKLSNDANHWKTFELIHVLDMLVKGDMRYYRLLFKEIKTGMYIIEEIAPELLFQFSTGKFYRDSYLTEDAPLGQKKEILLSGNPDEYKIFHMDDIINDNSFYDHWFRVNNDIVSFSNEIKSQYCIVYKYKNETIVLPAYLAGLKFFFVSTNLRRRIFDSRPENLYFSIEDEQNKVPIIKLKPGVAFSDGAYLIHYAQSQHARKSWKNILDAFNSELRNSPPRTWHIPLKITLPFIKKIKMLVRYSRLPNNTILIHEIMDHESFFSFKSMKIIMQGREDEVSRVTITKKNRRKKRRMNKKSPNSSNTYAGIRNRVEEQIQKYQDIKIEYITEETKHSSGDSSLYLESNESTELSSVDPKGEGDDGTSHLNVNQGDKKKPKSQTNRCKKIFTLDNFQKIYQLIAKEEGVVSPSLFVRNRYPYRADRGKCNIKEVYDIKRCKNRRMWHYFRFIYKDKHIVVMDIDQQGLSTGSSFFVLYATRIIKDCVLSQLLCDYAGGKKIRELQEEFVGEEITFSVKRHKCPSINNHEKIWMFNLLIYLKNSIKNGVPS
jgi:hypothetical protein